MWYIEAHLGENVSYEKNGCESITGCVDWDWELFLGISTYLDWVWNEDQETGGKRQNRISLLTAVKKSQVEAAFFLTRHALG